MAEDKRAVFLHLEPGTPTFGLWCPDCLLPSAALFPVNILLADGVTQLGTLTTCTSCERQW